MLADDPAHFGVNGLPRLGTAVAALVDGAAQIPQSWSPAYRTEPSFSLIPNSVTIRRASSVARWMSSTAPVLMVPKHDTLSGAATHHDGDLILELVDRDRRYRSSFGICIV